MIKLQDYSDQRQGADPVRGRDSAGKGGVIKRITQRLDPRVACAGAAETVRLGNVAMVFPTLCTAPSRRR